ITSTTPVPTRRPTGTVAPTSSSSRDVLRRRDPVAAFDVSLEFARLEIHLAQVARAVALGLVVEVRRSRIAAFAAGGDRARGHLVAELHRGDEAVAAGAVVALRAGPAMRAERRQRAPARGGERHRDARFRIV